MATLILTSPPRLPGSSNSAAARRSFRAAAWHLDQVGGQGAGACYREDTEDMDRERAETHLRLLAEAELRRATRWPVDGGLLEECHSARLELVAQALHAVHAFDMGAANEIQAELALALGVQLPGARQQPGFKGFTCSSTLRPASS